MAEKKKNDKVMKTGGGKNRQLPKVPNEVYGTGKVSEAKKKKIDKINRKINKVTAPVRKKFKKVTAPVKKKIKDFSNRKSKEYQKSARDNARRIFGGSPFKEKQSIPSKIADGLLFLPKNMRNSAMQGINKKINTKEERKAAGLDYKAGGYVLSAEDKRRRKTFKSSKATKNNTGMKKLKEGGMVIVDRNYLKGK